MGAGAAIGIAIGGTSLICYALMRRSPRRRDGRGSSDSGTGADFGGYAGGGGHFGWFGGDHSPSDHSASVGPGDFSGGDSGGGDSGGGGDGGGGGGG
jgi:hypothetical protein